MGGKTYLFDLIQQCTYINKFMALPVSSSIVSYLSPGLDNNQLPLQWKEVSVTLNGAVMSFASCCASLWRRCLLGLFVWPVGSHLVWMMAAVRVPLASVTPTMAAWSHAAYSASCSGCAALQRAWRIAAEVSTSLARTMQNAARVSATSATAMEDRGKQQLGAAGCLNCRLHRLRLSICDEREPGCSVWAAAAAAQADRLWWEWFRWSKQLWLLGAATYHSGGVCWLGRGPWWTQQQQVWLTATAANKTQLSIVHATLSLAAAECVVDELHFFCSLGKYWWLWFRWCGQQTGMRYIGSTVSHTAQVKFYF